MGNAGPNRSDGLRDCCRLLAHCSSAQSLGKPSVACAYSRIGEATAVDPCVLGRVAPSTPPPPPVIGRMERPEGTTRYSISMIPDAPCLADDRGRVHSTEHVVGKDKQTNKQTKSRTRARTLPRVCKNAEENAEKEGLEEFGAEKDCSGKTCRCLTPIPHGPRRQTPNTNPFHDKVEHTTDLHVITAAVPTSHPPSGHITPSIKTCPSAPYRVEWPLQTKPQGIEIGSS